MMTALPRARWSSAAGRRGRFSTVLLLAGGWAVCVVTTAVEGRCAEPAAADVAAIRAAAAAYRAAIAKGDAAAIRAAWTADGDVVDGWGNQLAVEDIAAVTARADDGARPEMRLGETRLRFITPEVAVEDGAVDVVFPGAKTPLEGRFSAIWTRQNGTWKLAGIREAELPTAPAGTLEDLEWMVGEWALVPDADAQAAVPEITMTVRWDAAHMFLLREVRQAAAAAGTDQPPAEIQQRIGWDPLVGRIRSWSFATDGSRSEATWFRDGTSWMVKGATVHPDGRQTTTVNIYTFDGKDRFTWRTMEDPLESTVGLLTRATWIRKQGEPQR